MPIRITIPLLIPNEPEANIVNLLVSEGQFVRKGDPLATLETTKSASDLYAEHDGFVAGLMLEQGDIGRAGDVFCYLAETPDWKPEAAETSADRQQARYQSLSELRITKPAERLAIEMGIDIDKLPADKLITEQVIRQFIQSQTTNAQEPVEEKYDDTAVVIYGGGGHGKTVIDLLRSTGAFKIVGIIDDGITIGKMIMGLPVLGGSEILSRLRNEGVHQAVNAVGGIGDITIRVQVFEKLSRAGFLCPALIHPSALVEPSAKILDGAQVFAQAYVGSESIVGFGCIVNTGAVVSHDCVLADHVNISPGAILAGEVHVGAQSLIGMGVTVNLRVKIGMHARLGNGATVKQDVPDKGFVRAGSIWP